MKLKVRQYSDMSVCVADERGNTVLSICDLGPGAWNDRAPVLIGTLSIDAETLPADPSDWGVITRLMDDPEYKGYVEVRARIYGDNVKFRYRPYAAVEGHYLG